MFRALRWRIDIVASPAFGKKQVSKPGYGESIYDVALKWLWRA
jgi:hypothetical protein